MFEDVRGGFFGEEGFFFDCGSGLDVFPFWDCCAFWLDGFWLIFFSELSSENTIYTALETAYLCPDTGGFYGADFFEACGGSGSGSGNMLCFASETAYLCPDTGGFYGADLFEACGGSGLGNMLCFASETAYLCSDTGGLFGADLSRPGGFSETRDRDSGSAAADDFVGNAQCGVSFTGNIIGKNMFEFCGDGFRSGMDSEKSSADNITEKIIGGSIFSGGLAEFTDGCIGLIMEQIKKSVSSEIIEGSMHGSDKAFADAARRRGYDPCGGDGREVIDRVARSLGAALDFCAEGVHS